MEEFGVRSCDIGDWAPGLSRAEMLSRKVGDPRARLGVWIVQTSVVENEGGWKKRVRRS